MKSTSLLVATCLFACLTTVFPTHALAAEKQPADENDAVTDKISEEVISPYTGNRSRRGEVDPETGISIDPANWYTPTTPREVLPENALQEDLAAAYYVLGDGTGLCSGDYRLRKYPYDLQADDADFPLIAEADSISRQMNQAASLAGNVTVSQGNRLLLAPRAEIDEVQRVATFVDGVRIDQPGMIMQGEAARVDLDTRDADLENVQFILLDAMLRGDAQVMQQSGAGDLLLDSNGFTRCEPGNNGWRMEARELDIKKGAIFGTARGAVLKLKSVPVFYSPYLQFPVSDERVSGFLFPNLAYSDEDGADLSIPYYLNLAPDYDATVIPRYVSRRGAGLEAEFRHMSAWQDTVLAGGFLPDDDIFNGSIDEEDYREAGGFAALGPFEPADRWLGSVSHEGHLGRFRTLIGYTAASDGDYFRDLGSDLGVSSRRELERKGELQYNHDGLFMRLWLQRFQRLDVDTAEYQRLPEFELVYGGTLAGPVEFSLGTKWTYFERDTDGFTGLAGLTGSRAHIEPRLRLPFSWPFGFLNMSAGYRYTSYDLKQEQDIPGFDENPDRGIGVASVDGGLIFERDLNWFKQSLIQTLEPRLYYLWQEFEDQDALPRFDLTNLTFGYRQLYRDNRFAGVDRIGDADQLSAGVTTRFIAADTGVEYFSASIGEIFYFRDRRVTLGGNVTATERQSSSAIASELTARIASRWQLTGTVIWDPHDNEVDEGGMGFRYQDGNRRIFNLGFRNVRDQNIEQTDVSLYWPLSKRIALMGRWNFDLVSKRTIEGFGGLEYNDCCLQVRLVARRFLDTRQNDFSEVEGDDGIFLQIVFKGLAGFGTKVESVLERGIRGYRSPNRQDFFNNNH